LSFSNSVFLGYPEGMWAHNHVHFSGLKKPLAIPSFAIRTPLAEKAKKFTRRVLIVFKFKSNLNGYNESVTP